MPLYIVIASATIHLLKRYRYCVRANSEKDARIKILEDSELEGEELDSRLLVGFSDTESIDIESISLLEEGKILAIQPPNRLLLTWGAQRAYEAYYEVRGGLARLEDRLEVNDLVGFYASHGEILWLEKRNKPALVFKSETTRLPIPESSRHEELALPAALKRRG